MVAGGQGVAQRAAARKRPRPGPSPARWLGRRARAPAVQRSPPEPLGPQDRLNEWGRKAGAGPSPSAAPARRPGPRPAPASRADQVPAPPASPARTGYSARLSRPGLGGWGQSGRSRDRGALGTRPARPPSPGLACAQGRRPTRPRPLPPGRPAATRCGRMWRPGRGAGAGAEGDEIPPLSRDVGFLLREVLFTQPKFAGACFARPAPARVKRGRAARSKLWAPEPGMRGDRASPQHPTD